MKLSLLVMTPGKQEGRALEIKLPQFLVGRDPQCQLRPASPLISKRHCALIQRDGKVFVRDFGSTNGTYVNDERVEGERELKHDDQLKIGPIHFAVRIESTPSVATKTPAPATKAAPAKPPKSDTPAPPTAPPRTAAEAEDDIAAMLLSLDEGETSSTSLGSDGVPDGSTVFDLKVQPGGEAANPADAKEKAKGTSGDTRSAAANILEKMMKRPRNQT
jgi:pSer/pThr/pTyr-binding forkhead associated (FHA) protein